MLRPDDPPVEMRFAPPPGLVQYEKWIERRQVRVDFPDSRSTVLEVHSGLTREDWEVLPSGGFRITSVALQQNTLRDGEPVESPLPHLGIPFVFEVDSQGNFVRAVNLEQSIEALRKRLRRGPARELLESMLDPPRWAGLLEQSWFSRFDKVCGTTLEPGSRSYLLFPQDLPAGGPILGVVQQEVLGGIDGPGGEAVEIGLQLGGRRSAIAREPEARRIIAELEQGALALAERLEGEGERIVSVNSCLTVREVIRLNGEIRLNVEEARASGAVGLPERIRYRVDRRVSRGRSENLAL